MNTPSYGVNSGQYHLSPAWCEYPFLFLLNHPIPKVGFGSMMVLLFSCPLLNLVFIGSFVVTFCSQVAAFYFLVAIVVAMSAGCLLKQAGFEHYVKQEAYSDAATGQTGCGISKQPNQANLSLTRRQPFTV